MLLLGNLFEPAHSSLMRAVGGSTNAIMVVTNAAAELAVAAAMVGGLCAAAAGYGSRGKASVSNTCTVAHSQLSVTHPRWGCVLGTR